MKVPFGIAQIGKSISQRNYAKAIHLPLARIRADGDRVFLQARNQPGVVQTWRDARFQVVSGPGPQERQSPSSRAWQGGTGVLFHAAPATSNINFPWGWGELEGIAHRGDYDLTQHQKVSGKDMTYFDDETKERFLPHVIEPSAGATRATLAFLCEAYAEEMVEGESRTVLRLHPRLAPVKAAIFPLVKKEGMPELAAAICKDLQKHLGGLLR
jgi:glycyl-tRNA synthetase